MLDKRIKFDESCADFKSEEITYYFICPKEMLNGQYPEASAMELSIVVPFNHISAEYATVRRSPTMSTEDGDTDYDWEDYYLSQEEIKELLNLAQDKEACNCDYCHQNILAADGCVRIPIVHNGKEYEPIKVGDEGDFYSDGERCTDCGAKAGHYHHPGCDCERCPVCGGQLIGCGCQDEDGEL